MLSLNNVPDRHLIFFSEFAYDPNDELALTKELTLQVRKVIGPFAAPKKIYLVPDLPKTRSGKVRLFLEYRTRCFDFTYTPFNSIDHASYHAQDRLWRGRPTGRPLNSGRPLRR